MEAKARTTMELAALGRPFSLGMLYDCREDSVIPGLTLWDCDDLEKNRREQEQPNSEFEIVASESIEDKSSALNVEASLKASFLGGLVEVGGSAKYLNDQKTSKYQARVTLKYKTTTKFQELSMNHLGRGNVKHPYVFEQGIATHVVTGILYGAQGFFVFDREVSKEEKCQDIQGSLKVMIKKIPSLSIEGEGSLKMEDKDKANVEKFSCKFYGDFNIQKPPTTFQEAVAVYQSLPTLLGANGEKAIPVKVWLLPLTSLDSSAAKLVRQISIRLVQESQSVLEEFSELEMRWNDALRTSTAQQFPQICKKLKSFKEMCSEFKLEFQRTLAKKLPSIRGGGEEEAELAEILKKRHSSPFSSKNLTEWMDFKEREISILISFTNMMKNTKVVPSQSVLHEELLSAEHALCFVFTSLGKDEPYLSALSNYLKEKTDLQDHHTYDVEKEQWYLSKEAADDMRKKAKLFNDFSEANKENKNIKFLTVGLTNETQEGSSIYLYKEGFAVSENFEPPSKPETVTAADINHNSVKLKISPPTFGAENITSYSVEYCVSGEDGWQPKTEAKAEEVTVRDLKPNTEYVFRCRAVTSAGVGPANEVSIKTLPCNELTKSGSKEARFAEKLGLQSEKISSDWPSVYKLPLTEEDMNIDGCRRFHFGKESTRQNHTIMLVGATGSGKSTLINAMINYIVGVEWEDSFRFKLVDKDQLRSEVSVYNINHQDGFKIPFSLTIIDTPGFGETGDIERDKLISEQLCNLFSAQHGVSVIDAVCFVAQAALARLTPTQKYVFDSVLSIFGKDVAENIRILVTFTNSRRPPVLEAIKAAGVPCPKTKDGLPAHFKFNDSALFANNKSPVKEYTDDTEGSDCDEEEENDVDDDNDNAGGEDEEDDVDNDEDEEQHNYDQYNDDISFDQMFWTMGTESMKMFFAALNVIETKSLTVTKEVLKERKQLEDSVEELQEQIKLQLARYEGMTNTRKKLGEYESDINNNKNPEFNVSVMKPYKADISGKGNFLINCQQCHVTCHHLFSASRESEKGGCAEDGSLGFCTECPGKCHINVHFLQKYKWEYQEVTEKRKVKDLKEKYLKPIKDQTVLEGLRANLRDEECLLRNDIKNLVKRSAKSLDRLKEISLNPNPLHTDKYISMIIDGEKSETKPGWQKRVEALIDIRGRRSFLDQFWWRFRF